MLEEIATHRWGIHADRMALHLLRFEIKTRELGALLNDTGRAVYFNTAQMLLSVRFDKHGVDEGSEGVGHADSQVSWVFIGDGIL